MLLGRVGWLGGPPGDSGAWGRQQQDHLTVADFGLGLEVTEGWLGEGEQQWWGW